MSSFLIVGQLGSPYGIKGWLKVQSFTEIKKDILQYQPWHFYLHHQWVIIPINSSRLVGEQPIVQLRDCQSPEEARRYTGTKIGIMPNQLPTLPIGEYYWSQLIGLKVINKTGILLGTVDHLFETGSNDVLVVIGDKKRLIPYLPNQVIEKIDLIAQQMIVDWDPEF